MEKVETLDPVDMEETVAVEDMEKVETVDKVDVAEMVDMEETVELDKEQADKLVELVETVEPHRRGNQEDMVREEVVEELPVNTDWVDMAEFRAVEVALHLLVLTAVGEALDKEDKEEMEFVL